MPDGQRCFSTRTMAALLKSWHPRPKVLLSGACCAQSPPHWQPPRALFPKQQTFPRKFRGVILYEAAGGTPPRCQAPESLRFFSPAQANTSDTGTPVPDPLSVVLNSNTGVHLDLGHAGQVMLPQYVSNKNGYWHFCTRV